MSDIKWPVSWYIGEAVVKAAARGDHEGIRRLLMKPCIHCGEDSLILEDGWCESCSKWPISEAAQAELEREREERIEAGVRYRMNNLLVPSDADEAVYRQDRRRRLR